ncbi:MAG: putative C4-dicarboxylate transporter, small permease protein [Desulfacinum sp.]|jgi:TRAP-type C4-dicarboxylate transport system permease small subunit|nr:putative C4-dicarboxylate transporter, small permease protein [Desulfacinum sp.]
MERIKKIYDLVCKGEELAAGVFLVAIMVLIFASGVARTVGHPLGWGMDMATFLFAWTAFFSADIALRKDKHIRVEALVRKFPPRVQTAIEIFNYLVITAFLVFLIVYGIKLSYTSRFRTFQGIPGFSYMWVTLSVPVGSFLLLITTLIKGRVAVGRWKTEGGPTAEHAASRP